MPKFCGKMSTISPPKGVKQFDHHAKKFGAHGGSDVERAGREFDVQERWTRDTSTALTS